MSSDATLTAVTGIVIRDNGFESEDSPAMVVASRIKNSGQMAYVDPHSCCDIKAPLMAPITMNGRNSENPVLRLMVITAAIKEMISKTGQRASSRSALSE